MQIMEMPIKVKKHENKDSYHTLKSLCSNRTESLINTKGASPEQTRMSKDSEIRTTNKRKIINIQ